MAFAVEIIRLEEENDWVFYHYKSAGMDVKFGLIKISKKNGDVVLIESAELDESGGQATRAAWKLMQYWRKGEFPGVAYWNS